MATPSIRSGARLGIGTRFHVQIDGIDLGGWSKCSGLSVTFKTFDYVPLGHNGFTPVLPDRVTYDKIKLSRAINDIDTPKLKLWLEARANGAANGAGGIAVLGTDGLPVMTWNLRGVYPTKWTGPGMDAGSKSIAIEELELAHEGFLEV